MKIDAHQHPNWNRRDAAYLIADMDRLGIDFAWLLTWELPPDHDMAKYHWMLNPALMRSDGTHAGITLQDIIETCRSYPDRFIPGYCPDPRLPDAPGMFESAYQMYGVRICGEWKFRMLLDDPRCIELFRTAGRLNCPVVIHLDVPYLYDSAAGGMKYHPCWYGGTIDNLMRAMDACPDTLFIGHAPGFWRYISGDADQVDTLYPESAVQPGGRLYQAFDRYENLYADLSATSALQALHRDTEHARQFITRYADRLLFARDYYGTELYDFLTSLELSEHINEQLFCKNALSLVPEKPGSGS